MNNNPNGDPVDSLAEIFEALALPPVASTPTDISPPTAVSSPTDASPPTDISPPAMADQHGAPFTKYATWDGLDSSFSGWYMSVLGRTGDQSLNLGSAQHQCMTIIDKIPESRKSRLHGWLRARLDPIDGAEREGFVVADLLATIKAAYEPKDLAQKAQKLIFTCRQGPAQRTADFTADFETFCAEAGRLAPVGAAKVAIYTQALTESTRLHLAIHAGICQWDYEQCVVQVRNITVCTEALPEFQNRKGSKVTVFARADGTFIDAGNSRDAPPAQPAVDRDGDTRMSGINALRSGDDVTQLAAALVAAMGGANNAGRGSSGDRRGGGFARDSRPPAPPVAKSVRAERLASGACERCGESPSHRWSACRFCNFREDPTPRGGARGSGN